MARLPGGTINAQVEIDPGPLMALPEGGHQQVISVRVGGAVRGRMIRISADGTEVRLDGVLVTAASVLRDQFATAVVQVGQRRDAFLTAPTVIALLTDP